MKLLILFAFNYVVGVTYGWLDLSTPEFILKNINFVVYKGASNNTQIVTVRLNENPADSLLKLLDFSSELIFYGPGFRQEVDDKLTVAIMKAYLDKKVNIVQLDWSKLSFSLYPVAVYQLEKIAQGFAMALNELFKNRKITKPFYLIGHSMGAHLVSYIARNLYETPEMAIGLDPAGPLYYFDPKRFRKGIAKKVISLHTDSGLYGTLYQDTDLAIVANGGYRLQPGCKFSVDILSEEELCSHQKSVTYWIRIINDAALSHEIIKSLSKHRRKLDVTIN